MTLEIVGLPFTSAQEEGEETTEEVPHEEENPLIPEMDELIFGSLAFLLVFAVLAKFAFPKLNESMKARSDKIRGDLEKAESGRREADGLLQRYQEQLQEARGEAGRIIEEARKTAESMRKDMMAKAEDDARQVVVRAQEEIRAERERALQELRGSVGALAVELASRVVGESLDRDRHQRLIDGYIDEVGRMGGAPGNGNGNGGSS